MALSEKIYEGETSQQLDRRYLTAAAVRKRYGDISDMCLWRWLADPELNFPKPMRIGKIRFFDVEKLEAFDLSRSDAK